MSNFEKIKTPLFICEMTKLEENLKLLKDIQAQSGVKILLALKGFSLHVSFPLIAKYLYGASASSYNEVRLAKEKFAKEVHTYCPAYKDDELEEIATMSDSIIFNSLAQYERFYPQIKEKASCGLRINLEMPFDLPKHCNANRKQSRFGVLGDTLKELPQAIEGLHVHALCSQKSDAFEAMLHVLEKQFSKHLHQLKWVNFGGGHALTCKEYDTKHLVQILENFQRKYPNLTLYIEPSEAIVHETGILVASVLDIVHNEIDIAILDISVEVHMIDVMLTKKSPQVREHSKEGEYHYQLAGCSCAAGDIFGNYSFEKPLQVGDRVVFENQMAYSMVKSTFFNGINPADIAIKTFDGNIKFVKEFSYSSYLDGLG
ncbi:MAG: carboxynorspermidine decarboxylase [Campylobacterota bacterium]|nr:carboxynorspermidine decarboxylase [Campylobacterota bacterium]